MTRNTRHMLQKYELKDPLANVNTVKVHRLDIHKITVEIYIIFQ